MSNHSQEKEFLQLVMQQQGIIHKICRLYCKDSEDRQDLFQEILLQLWRSYASYRQEAKLTTWMYRVGLNTAISSLRKSRKKLETNTLDEQMLQFPEPSNTTAEEEAQLAFLYQAIDQLNQVEKALVMLYLEDNSYDDIAQIMGISKTNVGAKLTRLKQKLQKILNPALSCN